MKIYFDNNIIISIEEGEIDFLTVKEKYVRDYFVYSYAHIQELLEAEKNKDDLIKKRLKTISFITENFYTFPDTYSINFKTEDPQKVINLYNETILVTTLFRNAAKNFNVDREKIIELFEIDIKRINNYKPEELIKNIDEVLKKKLFIDLKGFIDMSGNSFRDNVSTTFNFLDVIGFWKDKKTKKSNLARTYDAAHTFFASACDIFVSNDERARNKAKVVYSLYNLSTKILSYDEFINYKLPNP